MGHPDFRVGGKIFATLWPRDGRGMVQLTPDEQEIFTRIAPEVFSPVPGKWGLRGSTRVELAAATEDVVRDALAVAWRLRAPKKLLRELDPL